MNPNELLTALWASVKRMGVTAGLIGTAILLALAGAKAVKRRNKAQRKENQAFFLQKNNQIENNLEKASALIESANLDKQKAYAAKAKIKQQLEKLSENPVINLVATTHNGLRNPND